MESVEDVYLSRKTRLIPFHFRVWCPSSCAISIHARSTIEVARACLAITICLRGCREREGESVELFMRDDWFEDELRSREANFTLNTNYRKSRRDVGERDKNNCLEKIWREEFAIHFFCRTDYSSKILLNGNYSIRSKVVRSNEWLCLNTNFSFY